MTKEERYEQFMDDMEEAGYDIEEDYQGRSYYEGPAVRIEGGIRSVHAELQDVIRATKLYLQWDEMGSDGLVVYPH